MNENEILSILETLGTMLTEGVKDYRKYSDIGRDAALRSLSDDDLFLATASFIKERDTRNALAALRILDERFPGIYDRVTNTRYLLDNE